MMNFIDVDKNSKKLKNKTKKLKRRNDLFGVFKSFS